jgi:putative membrane protein
MAASVASTVTNNTKSFKPNEIEIPRTSSTNNDAPALLSPRSWRGRGETYQPPSRRQTNGSLDAEDYFVRLLNVP